MRFTQGMTEAGLCPSVPKKPEGHGLYTIPTESANPLPARAGEGAKNRRVYNWGTK